MPKAFTEHEKLLIKKRLFEVAEECLTQYGVKKTTVDELVKRVNIPKGTFYLFYDSKEILFFELFKMKHDAMQNYFLNQVSQLKGEMTSSLFTEIIYDLYKSLDNSFLFTFLTSGDMELVMRKIPEEMILDHHYQDDMSMEKLIALLPNMSEDQVKIYSASLRLALISILHKKDIGEETFDQALKLTIRGIIMQMLKESNYD